MRVTRREIGVQLYRNQSAARQPICFSQSQVTSFFPLHWHDYYEMEFVAQGRGTHWLNNQPVELRAGSAYLLTPSDLHRVEARPGEPLTIYSLKLSGALPSGTLVSLLAAQSVALSAQLMGAEEEEVSRLFPLLGSELRSDAPYRVERANALATLLVTGLMRHASAQPAHAPANERLSKVRAALSYIRAHSGAALTLEEVARVASLSPCYFSSLFAQVVGCSYTQYLTDCRMQVARALLLSGRASVTDAAMEAGFGSMSQFFRSFRASYGMTPGAWRSACSARVRRNTAAAVFRPVEPG